MRSYCLLALAASIFSSTNGTPVLTKRTAPPNPISVKSTTFLGEVKSNMDVVRDLGFVGMIKNTMIYTYGDTQTTSGNFYMVSDSSSIGTSDPLKVINTQLNDNGTLPASMIAQSAAEEGVNLGFGGTNVIPTHGNQGMMFYLKNHRSPGPQYIVGAGVASVTLSSNKTVSTSRIADHWWDTQAGEPSYGDIGAYSDGNYIWGYGHGGPNGQYTYLTRVKVGKWQHLDHYEYYDNSTDKWSNKRLYNPTEEQGLQWNSVDGSAWNVGQGQMIWSHHYKTIVWVYTLGGCTGAYARTAKYPRGPWSEAVTLFESTPKGEGDYIYCAVANPYFDSTGKSLVVTVDNGAATVQATKVIFN